MMNRKNAGRAFIIHRSSFIVSGPDLFSSLIGTLRSAAVENKDRASFFS